MPEYDEQPEPTAAENAAAQAQSLRDIESQIATEIQRGIRDGTIDDRVLDRWEDLQKASGPNYFTAGQYAGAKTLLAELGKAGVSQTDISHYQTRLDNISQGVADPALGADLLRTLRQQPGGTAATSTAPTAPSSPQRLHEPRRPASPAQRRSDAERLMNPNTPLEALREIRNRQKAAGE